MSKMTGELAMGEAAAAHSHEAELVRQAKAHSAEAWTEIYNAHYQAIFRYVRARLFDTMAAEDIATEVFVRALKAIDSYRYQGRPLLAWLYRIAHNLVASHQRQLLKSQGRGLTLPHQLIDRFVRRSSWSEATTAAPDPSSLASGHRDPAMLVERLDLRQALMKLTEAQREVLTLRFAVGLTSQEIAAVVGKKPAAVYSLQARALLALRDQLQ